MFHKEGIRFTEQVFHPTAKRDQDELVKYSVSCKHKLHIDSENMEISSPLRLPEQIKVKSRQFESVKGISPGTPEEMKEIKLEYCMLVSLSAYIQELFSRISRYIPSSCQLKIAAIKQIPYSHSINQMRFQPDSNDRTGKIWRAKRDSEIERVAHTFPQLGRHWDDDERPSRFHGDDRGSMAAVAGEPMKRQIGGIRPPLRLEGGSYFISVYLLIYNRKSK